MTTIAAIFGIVAALVILAREVIKVRRRLHMQKMKVTIYWNEIVNGASLIEYVDTVGPRAGQIQQGTVLLEWTEKHSVLDKIEKIQAVGEGSPTRHVVGVVLHGTHYAPIAAEDRTYFVKHAA